MTILNGNKTKYLITLSIAFIFLIFMLYDLFSLLMTPENYSRVYQIGPESSHWQFYSIRNCVIWKLAKIVICGIYILTAFISRRNQTKKGLVIGVFVFEVLIIMFGIRYFYCWYISGFDHYPSFDPYFF